MRKLLLVLITAAIAFAQKTPRVEIFGGYSYLRVRGYAAEASLLAPGSGDPSGRSFTFPAFTLNGWGASVAVNATSWFGVTAEASGHYGMPTRSVGGMPVTLGMHEYNYLFGPRFTYRHGPWAPYVHASFGVAHGWVMIGGPEILVPISVIENKFAMAFGGGLDVKLYRGLAVRLAQADWLTTRFVGGQQRNIQLTTGLVVRL